MDISKFTAEQKAQLFERDRRIEAVLYAMSEALIAANHPWTPSERVGFDWAARTLRNDQQALAA